MNLSLPSSKTITRAELPNGIIVLVYENHSSPAVIVSGYLWAGALSEAPEQAGLAAYASGMLMRGTKNRTFGQINSELESVGARLGFQSGMHTTGFGGKALAEDLGLLLDVLGESLQRPTFPGEEVERLRGQILTNLQRRAHDTRQMAKLTFDALLYPNHPYGRSVRGYEKTVEGLSREHLAGYYQGHYSPQGMVIAVVGAVSTENALRQVGARLGGWHPPAATPNRSIPPSVQLDELRRQETLLEGKIQSDIMLGWHGMARNDPDFMKASLTNTVLGVFGMMGRLGNKVRDEQGLAYYVYSRLEAGIAAGPWVAVAGVDPRNVDRAISGILHEVRRLRDEPVPATELADSQAYLTGSMPLRLETNEGIAVTLLSMERYELGLDYLLHYADLVNGVRAEDLQEIAQKYLDPDVYAAAIAGPGVSASE
jgi:zinc protease